MHTKPSSATKSFFQFLSSSRHCLPQNLPVWQPQHLQRAQHGWFPCFVTGSAAGLCNTWSSAGQIKAPGSHSVSTGVGLWGSTKAGHKFKSSKVNIAKSLFNMKFQVWALHIFQGTWGLHGALAVETLLPWAPLHSQQCLYHPVSSPRHPVTHGASPALPLCTPSGARMLPTHSTHFSRDKNNTPEFLRKPGPLQKPGFHTQL